MKLYKVDFTFSDSYRPKGECFNSVSLVVAAEDQFSALAVAWDKVKCLEVDEPKSFNAQRYDKCE